MRVGNQITNIYNKVRAIEQIRVLDQRNLCVYLQERATGNSSSVFNQISDCANYQFTKSLYCIKNKSFDACTYNINSIQENTNIIEKATNWNPLLVKETLQIKLKKPVLNSDLKASAQLQLFN